MVMFNCPVSHLPVSYLTQKSYPNLSLLTGPYIRLLQNSFQINLDTSLVHTLINESNHGFILYLYKITILLFCKLNETVSLYQIMIFLMGVPESLKKNHLEPACWPVRLDVIIGYSTVTFLSEGSGAGCSKLYFSNISKLIHY